MNIYQRINEVRKAVQYAKKDKAVEGYKAVTHDQITGLTRDHLVQHGIVIVPVLTSQKVELTGTQTSRGTPFVRMEASYRFDVVNIDDPNDKFSAEIAAHALDHGDKAPGKVLSYAKKALMLKLLEIESGDEDEDRQEQFKPKAAKGAIPANHGAGASLTPKQKNMVLDTHTAVVDALNEDRDADAYGLCESISDAEVDEKLYLWSMLDSKQRDRLKKQAELEKKAEKKAEPAKT